MMYPDFRIANREIIQDFKNCSFIVHPRKWQGVDVSNKPEMATHEVLNYSFKVALDHCDLETYAKQIKPNLPWADDHFLERVCGEPINPGKEWANWPWGNHADKFRDSDGQFNHNYMERYWSKYAGQTYKGILPKNLKDHKPNHGIRYPYGDLNDLVDLLEREPDTRQAFLPIFFPEDTGAVHGGRVPCTLGYHFIRRRDHLHIVYYLRSCDLYRHFRDDCYLTVRLLLWVLNELKKRRKTKSWANVKPGIFTMHITSLHCFRNDLNLLRED